MKITKYELNANTYIVSNDKMECIIIDPSLGMSYEAKRIKEKYDVKAIFLTHAHFDHIDGISSFLDLPIYLHQDEIDILKNPMNNLYYMFYGEDTPFDVNELELKPLFDNDIIDIIGLKFEVTHTPGHTKGSVCYKIDDYLFTGDTLFATSVGRWDFPTGDYDTLCNSIKKLLNKYQSNLKCLSGHEHETTLDDIKRYNRYVVEVLK